MQSKNTRQEYKTNKKGELKSKQEKLRHNNTEVKNKLCHTEEHKNKRNQRVKNKHTETGVKNVEKKYKSK